MRIRILLLLAAIACLGSDTARGAVHAGDLEVYAGGGLMVFEGNSNYKSQWLTTGGLGYGLLDWLEMEFNWGYVDTKRERSDFCWPPLPEADLGVGMLGAAALVNLDLGWRFFEPFGRVGIGAMQRTFHPGDSEWDAYGDLGGGFRTMFTHWVGLRTEATYLLLFDRPHNNFRFSVALDFQVPIRPLRSDKGVDTSYVAAPPSGPPQDPEPPRIVDSDLDGVPDSFDQCPGTPRGVVVDPRTGCPLDSDGDGVPDQFDQCPGTPRNVVVDYRTGCPLDSDMDGVPDYLDECPNTPVQARPMVDERGCWSFSGVMFDTDKATIKLEYGPQLDAAAAVIANTPNIVIRIDGHTDNRGTKAYNEVLSVKRAEAVRTALIERGIPPERLLLQGFAYEKPIASNDTAAGRAKNRRVELTTVQ